nr:F-box protein At4g18380 isoform X2 [Ziziphus jujuba var. spinosa]
MVKNRVSLYDYHCHTAFKILFFSQSPFKPEQVEQQQQQQQVVEEEQEEEDWFGQLPDEILLFIFNKILDAKSLVRCVSVSKRFASLVPQIDSVVLHLPPHLPIRKKGYYSSKGGLRRPLTLFKFMLNKFVSKPFRLLTKSNSNSRRNDLLYYSPTEVLRDFKEIKSLRLELPSHGGELGLNKPDSDLSLLKWNAQFGSKLRSCTILGANSLERKPNSQINKQSKGHEENDGEIQSLLDDEELKLRIVWMVSSLIAASARHHLLKQVVAGFPTLSDVVIADGNKQGKLSMSEEQLGELRSSLDSSMVSESSSLERSMIPDLSMKLWYAPVLELPASGFVMKGATLISIKPLDVEKKGNDHGDQLEVSGFHDEEDEEQRGLFGEAVKELMKMKKTYVMEMTSF